MLSAFDATQPKPALWNLHPRVQAAFEAAWAPVQRRETPSAMERTSKKRNWWPRRGRWITKLREKGSMPRWLKRATVFGGLSFSKDEAKALRDAKVTPATYKRLKPKRDKTISSRQWRRQRSALLRAIAA
jgi:hypothetical protein